MFEVTGAADGDLLTITVKGELDAATAPQFRSEAKRLDAEHAPRVEVDVSDLALVDSSGVAALVSVMKGVKANGGRFQVINANGQPLAIFKLLRMDKVFLP